MRNVIEENLNMDNFYPDSQVKIRRLQKNYNHQKAHFVKEKSKQYFLDKKEKRMNKMKRKEVLYKLRKRIKVIQEEKELKDRISKYWLIHLPIL